MERKISQQVRGYRTTDGAGVSLVRVLGNQTVQAYDPILMLDSFDSTNPDDYTAGFPLHPHRGIETISYVYRGYMTHKDSLGNEDTIGDGEVQWMTAGSGIMHEEKLPAAERLLGVQLWLNLPAKDKMAPPAYHSIKNADIEDIDFNWGKLRLLAGEFEGKVCFGEIDQISREICMGKLLIFYCKLISTKKWRDCNGIISKNRKTSAGRNLTKPGGYKLY